MAESGVGGTGRLGIGIPSGRVRALSPATYSSMSYKTVGASSVTRHKKAEYDASSLDDSHAGTTGVLGLSNSPFWLSRDRLVSRF